MKRRRTGGLHIAGACVCSFMRERLCAWLSPSLSRSPSVFLALRVWTGRVSVREEAPPLRQHPRPEEDDGSVPPSVDPGRTLIS